MKTRSKEMNHHRHDMSYKKMKLLKAGLILVGAAVLGALVMLLWNWVMPALFAGAARIDYWHALGLLILCRILFGGFRGHGHADWHARREHWQRWQAMTPEEREQFRAQRGAPFCRPQPQKAQDRDQDQDQD
jgi:hypothetical protein